MKKTPLNKIHKQLGARMCEFAGWEMPVIYTGVMEEHRAVRNKAGIFDVSHMGEIEIRGPKALALVQRVACNDASRLKDGDCQYSALLTDQATFVDDIIVNRLAEDHFLICVNASNTDKDCEWVRGCTLEGASVENTSDRYFQIALQGPEAVNIMSAAVCNPPTRPFSFARTKLAGVSVLLARTGYTGEDGFEIYGDPKDAEKIWALLMEKGAVPCGLGARDTLRLEAALSLYGHEIDATTNPYEAGLDWIVKWNKGDFIGREALAKISKSALQKKLVGIQMTEPGIARQGYKIFTSEDEPSEKAPDARQTTEARRRRTAVVRRGAAEEGNEADGVFQRVQEIGFITSGTKSPSLDRAIALGYVDQKYSQVGTKIRIDIHRKKREAIVVSLPFYKRRGNLEK